MSGLALGSDLGVTPWYYVVTMQLKKSLFFVSLLIVTGFFCLPGMVYGQTSAEIDAAYQEQLDELTALADEINDLQMAAAPAEFPVTDSFEVRGTVVEILDDQEIEGNRQMIFTVETPNDWYTVDTSVSLLEGLRYDINVGDDVFLQLITVDEMVTAVYLVDVVRTGTLIWMLVLFGLVVLAVGRKRGAASLVGLAVTLLVLFGGVLPLILNGAHPVFVTVIGAMIILAVNMHLSHGFNRSTLLAFASTVIGLILAWFFAELFVQWGDLSGLANEEAILLFFKSESIDWPAGILLAGIILGATGVLDDIAITQSETVQELQAANPKLTRKELFERAMRIGRHHIASTINTLVLAYVGVALPLFLLFMYTEGIDAWRFLNEEPVAEEIVRTLAGTLALILTVPISTWLATMARKQ
jgi:uncharacterized membrane protein